MRKQTVVSWGRMHFLLLELCKQFGGFLVSVKRMGVAGPLWLLLVLWFYELLLCSLPVSQLTSVYVAAMMIITHLARDTGSFSGLRTLGYLKLFMSKL